MDEAESRGGKRLKYVATICRNPRSSKGLVLAALIAFFTSGPLTAQPILIESRTSTNTDNAAYWSYPAGTWGSSGNLSLAATTPPFAATGSKQTASTAGPPSFRVQPTNSLSLQPGTVYAVQVTVPSSSTQPPPDDLVVGISASGLASNTLPATTTAFSTGGTNRWITLGQIIASNGSPSLTFTYVSGSIGSPSQRFYAQCVRFVPQANASGLHIWSGGASADTDWNNPTNWQGGVAPNLGGDDVMLAGSSGLACVPDGPFSLNSLTFAANAGAFIIGTNFCGPLAISSTNGINNLSLNNQVIRVPLNLGSVPLVVNTGTRTLTISNNLSGNAGYGVNATGTLYLRYTSDITGPVTVNSNATLRLQRQDCIGGTGAGAGDVTLDAGTLQNDDLTFGADFITANRNIIVGAGGATLNLPTGGGQSLIFSGVVVNGPGSGTFYKTGTGKLTLGGSSANTFTGLTSVNAGRLILNKSSANAVAGDLAIAGGTVELAAGEQIVDTATVTISNNGTLGFDSGFTETVGKVVLDSGSITGALATVSANSFEMHSGTVGVALNGSAPLVKMTTNTVTLTVDCFYTGNTTVSNGTLLANANIYPTAVTVMNGGTLGGSGAINAPVTVQSGGTLSASRSPGLMTINSSLVLSPGSASCFEISKTPLANDTVQGLTSVAYEGSLVVTNLSGTLEPGDSFQLFSSAAYTGAFGWFSLPPLPAGLAWDTSGITNNGTLTVTTAHPQITQTPYTATQVMLSGTGGVAYSTYYILTSTNVASPLASWTPLCTNNFALGGFFSYTNTMTPGLHQRFFILKMP